MTFLRQSLFFLHYAHLLSYYYFQESWWENDEGENSPPFSYLPRFNLAFNSLHFFPAYCFYCVCHSCRSIHLLIFFFLFLLHFDYLFHSQVSNKTNYESLVTTIFSFPLFYIKECLFLVGSLEIVTNNSYALRYS